MSIAEIETSSRVNDGDADVSTRGIHSDDWLLPQLEPERIDATTSLDCASTSEIAVPTAMRTGRTLTEPVRKDQIAPRFPKERVKLLQQWECIVRRVDGECVECEMHDLTDQSCPTEYAEVYIDEFNVFDRPLLQEGTVFYWSIGHETNKAGTVRRYSELRVRRMPQLSKSEQREIEARASRLAKLFSFGQ